MKAAMRLIVWLAMSQVLAAGAVLGWLGATDRLSRERVDRVIDMFRETTAEESARLAAEEAERESARSAAAEAERFAGEPLGSAAALAAQEEAMQASTFRHERLERDVRNLERLLQRERLELEADRAQLDADRAAFEATREELRQIEGSEQFAKSVAVLEAQKPDVAREMLRAMLNDGQKNAAVAYLNAMEERARNKVVASFGSADPVLAAELLESLRNKGLEVRPRSFAEAAGD